MKRLFFAVLLLAVSAASSHAQTLNKFTGTCTQGGQVVTTSGITSSTKHSKSLPSATATIYNYGTSNAATIYDDAAGNTPKANPFTCSSTDASYTFYAPASYVDLRLSGTGVASPFTVTVATVNPVADNDPRLLTGYFNVKASPYDAAGDGATDDTAAIQAAITAAAGRPVYLPPGTYKITSTLTNGGLPLTFVSDSIVGQAFESYIPSLYWRGAAGGTMLAVTGATYLKVQGVGFNTWPSGTANGADTAISIDAPTREGKIVIDNVLVRADGGERTTFKGIYLSPTATSNVENISITHTYVQASPTYTMSATRGACVYMGNNSQSNVVTLEQVFLRNCTTGFRSYGQNVSIRNSFIQQADIGITNLTPLLVDNVHFESVKQVLSGSSNITFRNCVFEPSQWLVATPVFAVSGGQLFVLHANYFSTGYDAAQALFSITSPSMSLDSRSNAFPLILTNSGVSGFTGYTTQYDAGLGPQHIHKLQPSGSFDILQPVTGDFADSYLRIKRGADAWYTRFGSNITERTRWTENLNVTTGETYTKDDGTRSGWDIRQQISTSDSAAGFAVKYVPAGSTTAKTLLNVSGVGTSNFYYGADVASASTITPTGNSFTLTGTTTVSTISTTGVSAGTVLHIVTSGGLTFNESGNIDVSGGTSLTTGANDLVIALWDGTKWRLK